jgi:hypothetical protein
MSSKWKPYKQVRSERPFFDYGNAYRDWIQNTVLTDRRADWKRAHDTLEEKVRLLDAREHAALQCLLVRDCHHLFALYLSFVMSKIQRGEASSRLAPAVEEEAPGCRLEHTHPNRSAFGAC